MVDRQIYELDPKPGKHKAVDTVVSSVGTGEMTRSAHELFLATELNPMSAPISTTYKALPFNPLLGRAVVSNSGNTKAYGVRPVDLGQESVGVKQNDTASISVQKSGSVYNFLKEEFFVGSGLPCKDFTLSFVGDFSSIYSSYQPIFGTYADTINTSGVCIMYGSTGSLEFMIRNSDAGFFPGNILAFILPKSQLPTIKKIDITSKTVDGSQTLTIYVNGIVKSSRTTTEKYLSLEGHTTSVINTKFACTIRFDFFNYALTASDVSYYWNNGRPDLAIVRDSDKWGSNTSIIPTNASQFTEQAGVDWWGKTVGVGTLNTNCLRLTENGTTGDAPNIFKASLLEIGKRYKVKYKLKSSDVKALYLSHSLWKDVIIISNTPTVAGGDYQTWEFIGTSLSTTLKLYAGSAASVLGVTSDFDDIEVYQIGSVADYSPASISDPVTVGSDTATITAGNAYEVTVALTSDDEVNPSHASYIGANDKSVGTRFVAVKSATLNTDGRVKLVAVTSWLDNSTNALNATVSGSPMLVKTQVETTQGQGVIDTVMQKIITSASINKILCTVPAGWRVDDISLDRTTQPSSNVTFSVGTTTTGTNIVNSYVYDRTFTSDTLYPMLRKYFSKDTSQDIYISAVNWFGGVFDFTITLRRV